MATDWDRQGTFPASNKKMGELGLLGMMVLTEMEARKPEPWHIPWPCRKSRIPALQAPSPCR